MAAEEDYEILPHQLLADLKYDVESLKKKLTQPDSKIQELILEIESMKDGIHELNEVFHNALNETKTEDPHQEIKVMREKMETVLSQNETIARGMVAISDKLEEFMGKNKVSQVRPSGPPQGISQPTPQHTMGPPSMPGSRVAPTPRMEPSMEGPSIDFPPPPPEKKKRSGLFR